MGRKRKKNGLYFGPVEEQAVRDFLKAQTQEERDRIYNLYLRYPFNKMIDSIIRRYKLYRKNIPYDELHSDTLGYLMEKFSEFNEELNYKAYSYYGTICKNYLLGKLIEDNKVLTKNVSYEDIYLNVIDNQKYSYDIDENPKDKYNDLISEIVSQLQNMLTETTQSGNLKLKNNERKVAMGLIYILENWDTVFESMGNSHKYNKLNFLLIMEEITLLPENEIKNIMKKFKRIYKKIKNAVISKYENL